MGAAGYVTIAPLDAVWHEFLETTGKDLNDFWPYLGAGNCQATIGGVACIVVYEDDQGYHEWDDPFMFNIDSDKPSWQLNSYDVPDIVELRKIIEFHGEKTEVWT